MFYFTIEGEGAATLREEGNLRRRPIVSYRCSSSIRFPHLKRKLWASGDPRRVLPLALFEFRLGLEPIVNVLSGLTTSLDIEFIRPLPDLLLCRRRGVFVYC